LDVDIFTAFVKGLDSLDKKPPKRSVWKPPSNVRRQPSPSAHAGCGDSLNLDLFLSKNIGFADVPFRTEVNDRQGMSDSRAAPARLTRKARRPAPCHPAPVNRLWLLLVPFAACWWSACSTARPLPALKAGEPGWRIRQGQAIWRSKGPAQEIAGELLLATHPDGRIFLQFTKTPLPFVVVRSAPDSWEIEFVAENKRWSGRGKPPPGSAWLQLARCLTGALPPDGWRWQGFEDDRWRLENKFSGEMLEGYLTP